MSIVRGCGQKEEIYLRYYIGLIYGVLSCRCVWWMKREFIISNNYGCAFFWFYLDIFACRLVFRKKKYIAETIWSRCASRWRCLQKSIISIVRWLMKWEKIISTVWEYCKYLRREPLSYLWGVRMFEFAL